MPMTDRNVPCSQEVVDQLTKAGFRVTMDDRNEKIGYKIREAQVHKVPYMVIIGDKDEEKGHHLGARAQDRRNHADGACRVY